MNRLKHLASRAVRWSWFGLLVLLAFGYLAAGLSQRPPASVQRAAADTATETTKHAAAIEGAHDEIASAVARVDAQWRRVLDDRGLKPADEADWLTVCRRMSMALVGNGLSLEEIRELEALPLAQRESTHLRNLLNDPRFHHYWAERWTRYLVGTDQGQFIVYRRRRFRIWLAEAFAANRRYDQMVRDLITADGLWTDKPQVNFLTATFDSNDNQADPVRLAARTSRAFLGLRIDCLQCHNDFLGNVSLGESDALREGKQTDFHQLAAFYTSAKTNGLQGVRSGQADYKYKYLNEDEEVSVEPAVPFRADLLPSDGDARARLATWVTHPENHQSARAAVSHVWALLFGRPMGTSVDNLPLGEEVHPMLNVLADELVSSGFDLRYLITLIASSSAFRVDSRADFEITPEHEQVFAVFPLVRLRPEQVAGSVIQAARIKKTDRQSSLLLQLQTQAVTNDFVTQYGDMGEDEFTNESVTITQRLLMMNGQMIREIVEANPVLNTTAHLNMFSADDRMVVETAYLCALNRYPTETEKSHFVKKMAETTDRGQVIEDLVWVLVNSSEMAWNH